MEGTLSTVGPSLGGIPLVFLLFGAVLLGIVVFQERTLQISLGGLLVILFVRVGFSRFDFAGHVAHEWAKLANLFGLLVGFTLLADHVERSHLPDLLAAHLPRGARGC